MNEKLKNIIVENFYLYDKAINTINNSIKICDILNINTQNEQEQNQFEALSSKFARATDIYHQKVVKSVLIYYEEDELFFIDRLNKSEKLLLIDNAEKLIDLRKQRNKIAHEYVIENIRQHWQLTLHFSKELLISFHFTKSFLENKSIVLN